VVWEDGGGNPSSYPMSHLSRWDNSCNKNGVILLGTGDVLGKLVYNKILFGDEHTDNITDGNHPTEAIFIENG